MKTLILLSSVLLVVGCCMTDQCLGGKTTVLPYFDGIYNTSSIKNYYIKVNGEKVATYNNDLFPNPIECNSDMSSVELICCTDYEFELYATFDTPTGDQKLASVTKKIKNKNGCAIIDVDPKNNKPKN